MKRLKQVAVRMRPPPPIDDPDHYPSEISTHAEPHVSRPEPVSRPSRITVRVEPEPIPAPQPSIEVTPARKTTSRRRHIWDLDPVASPNNPNDPMAPTPKPLQDQADFANPEPDPPPPPPPQPALAASMPYIDPNPDPSELGRAKTRVLGFHGPMPEADAFEQASHNDTRFPAGWLVVVDGPGLGAQFSVNTAVSTIGRGADQSIALDFGDTNISRSNHAAVAYDSEQNRFFLGHGNKSNIVRRNDMPVLATEELFDGDQIRIGKTTLRFVALCGPDFVWRNISDQGGDGTNV